MWTICQTCGAVVADEALHAAWHEAHGDVTPQQSSPTQEVVPDGI